MRRYTLAELEAMDTLATGQADDLKIERRGVHDVGNGFYQGKMRVWLSRCTVADGELYDNKVTVEWFDGQRWEEIDTYQAE